MFSLLEDLKFVITFAIFLILIITIVIFGLIGLTAGLNYINYCFNKTNCVVKVHRNIVYKGNCHFVDLDSVGENGNTKILKIYKDKTGLVLLKQYIDDNITITESEEK